MASTNLKLGLAAVVAAGLVTPLVIQQQQLKQLRADNAALLEQTRELDSLRADKARLAKPPADTDELARLRQEHLDLLRLRGEVTRLGNELRQRAATAQIALATNAVTPLRPTSQPVRLSYKGAALATVADGATFAMGGWQSAEGRRAFLFVTPTLAPESEGQPGSRSVVVKTKLVELAEGELSGALMGKLALVKNRGDSGFLDAAPVFLQNDPEFEALKGRAEYQGGTNVNVVGTPTVMTRDGQQAQVSVGQQVPALSADGKLEYHFQGTAIDLVPRITPDGRSISVEAVLSFVPPDGGPGSEVQPSDANVQRRLQGSR